MKYTPQLGRPIKHLELDLIETIVEGFTKAFSIRRAAGFARISPYHLTLWMKKGEEDLEKDIDSNYAQLFIRVAESLTRKASQYIERLEQCPENAGSLMWLMKTCMRNDYGDDSEEYKEVVEMYKKLSENFKKFMDGSQGVKSNENTMDSESVKSKESVAQEAG